MLACLGATRKHILGVGTAGFLASDLPRFANQMKRSLAADRTDQRTSWIATLDSSSQTGANADGVASV